jgi:cell division septation protein DedD
MTEQTKRCPYCDNEIRLAAKKCQHCGEWLEEKPTTGPTSISNPETLIRQALGDRYELHEVVGRGGMATVYRAVQKKQRVTVSPPPWSAQTQKIRASAAGSQSPAGSGSARQKPAPGPAIPPRRSAPADNSSQTIKMVIGILALVVLAIIAVRIR